MTPDKIRQAFAACHSKLPGDRYVARRGGNTFEHLLFMCEEGALYVEHRREKAMRWLGFVQGALWVLGCADIETLKNMNRPDEGGET